MGAYWNRWVEKIIAKRQSENPTERRSGFIRQLATELFLYASIGVFIALLAFSFGVVTPFVVFSTPVYEVPLLVGGVTGLLFQTLWDTWIRELEESEGDSDREEVQRELDPDQTTLDDDTGPTR